MSKEEKLEDGQQQKVDLDNILAEELGQFGRFQLFTIVLVALPVMFGAFTGEYIFTTARIPTRCRIPECDGITPDFSPPWQSSAIPTLEGGAFDQCFRYSAKNMSQEALPGTCPNDFFDTSTTEPCQEYVYQNDYTVVYDFDLACDEWRRSLIGSVRILGMFFVLPVTGYISDRWGRRVALTLNAFNCAWVGLARAFVNSYEWFLALQVLESALGSGGFSSSYILVTELVGPKYRVSAGATCSTIFALGQVIMGFVAWGVPHWRPLTQVLYAPQLLIVSYFWILSESVRWLMSKGRFEEAEKILKKVAIWNKKELSEKSLQALRASAEAEKTIEKTKEPWLPIVVFRSRVIFIRCCITPWWWITMTLVYFGLSINAVNLSGNAYLNYAIVSAIEIPGYWTAILLLDRIGRKPVIIGAYWLCAACQFTFGFMPEGFDTISMIVYLIGKYSISIVVTSLYIYTAELYPTKYRHLLFAFSSMLGRIGSIVAPLTPSLAQEVWGPLPSVMFGSFGLLSGLLLFLTPETLGTKLPDTFEEAENLAKNKDF